MKRLLLALCLLCSASPWLAAQDASAGDLKRGADYLKKTRAAFLESVEGLSQAQLTFKPAPTRWSVAEVAEHITAAESFLFGMVTDKVMKSPEQIDAATAAETDKFVLKAIPDRSNKVQAPEPLIPTKRFGSTEGTLKQFKQARATTLKFLNETKGLRGHAIDSPLGKKLDAYQWLLFIAAHSERHTKQIEEVKADPKFPKK